MSEICTTRIPSNSWQIRQGNLDAAHLVAQAFGRIAVHDAEKGCGARYDARGAEKGAARRVRYEIVQRGLVGTRLMRFGRDHPVYTAPDPLQSLYGLNTQIGRQGASEPQSYKGCKFRVGRQYAPAILAQAVRDAEDNADEADEIESPDPDAQPDAAPIGGYPPQRAVPKALRKVEHRQDPKRQTSAQQHPAPIQLFGSLHGISVFLQNLKPGRLFAGCEIL